jgi:hydrogenase expression/formation protein HypE
MISEKKEYIRLIDGEGGRATSRLIEDVFVRRFRNEFLAPLGDAAIADFHGARIAFTTDAFVVEPRIFPGGDIGKLAVCGTVNDLAAAGAKPLMLSAAFVLEEGFDRTELAGFTESMALAAKEAGVPIACGDTKVVHRGKADGVFITTSGIGEVVPTCAPTAGMILPGDIIAVSGDIARHAASIIAIREGLHADPQIESDCSPLWGMVEGALEAVPEIHAMRDPTRGGLGGVLTELAAQSRSRFIVEESTIPISPQIANICDLYGYDPLFMACEGRMVFIFPEIFRDELLGAVGANPYGKGIAVIGRVEAGEGVVIETKSGGRRLLVEPEGAPLPRIC